MADSSNTPETTTEHSILVVDDDAAVRSVIAKGLGRGGYIVYTAADVDSALAMLETLLVSVIVIDKNLQGDKSGLDLLRHVSQHVPFTKSIMLTGYASLESAIEAVRLGAYDYLTKPINIKSLRQKMAEACRAFELAIAQKDTLTKYEYLFETIPGLVWFMTDEGVVKRINKKGAEILGYGPEELVGRSYESLLDDDDPTAEVRWALKERRTGDRATKRQIVNLATKSGERRMFEFYSSGTYSMLPATDSNDPHFWGTVGMALDVTEMMRLQSQLRQTQKMEALGRLASGVAHDFNNLLTVILCSVQLLEDPELSDPVDEMSDSQDLRNIRVAATRAAEMTRQLLLFSREQPIDRKDRSLSKLVTGMNSMLSRLIRENVTLQIVNDGEPDVIRADKTQIEQVIMNLCVNARDAMPDGGRLSIQTRRVEVDTPITVGHSLLPFGEYVELVVSDTGTGMSEEVRQRAFDPFFTTKGAGEGTGLGLATAYGIVKQHDGYLDLRSVEGEGTSVLMYFPTIDDVDGATAEVDISSLPMGGETVLLVEDEEMVRMAVTRGLEGSGYHVLACSHAAAALVTWDEWSESIALIITDLVMPGMRGSALAKALRNDRPDIPIIFVSGHSGEKIADDDVANHRALFIHKPIRLDVLLVTMRELLDEAEEVIE